MVGDSQIGKTSLMVKYVEGSFDEDYIQTLGMYSISWFYISTLAACTFGVAMQCERSSERVSGFCVSRGASEVSAGISFVVVLGGTRR